MILDANTLNLKEDSENHEHKKWENCVPETKQTQLEVITQFILKKHEYHLKTFPLVSSSSLVTS